MITLSLDVYESKDYANLYRAWVRLNKFYLFKKNMNLNTEYFFIVRETCYRSEQTFFFTPSKWLSHCPDFRTFVIELSMKGVAIASHYVLLYTQHAGEEAQQNAQKIHIFQPFGK